MQFFKDDHLVNKVVFFQQFSSVILLGHYERSWIWTPCLDIESVQETGTHHTPAAAEVSRYLIEAQADENFELLKYWQSNQQVFRCLSKMAKNVLAVSATSTPSERYLSLKVD